MIQINKKTFDKKGSCLAQINCLYVSKEVGNNNYTGAKENPTILSKTAMVESENERSRFKDPYWYRITQQKSDQKKNWLIQRGK